MYSSVLTVLSSLSNSCTSIILIKATINNHGHWRDVSSRNNHYVYPLACSLPDVPCLGPPPPTLHNHNQSPVTIPLNQIHHYLLKCDTWSQSSSLSDSLSWLVPTQSAPNYSERSSERKWETVGSSSFSQATTADIWLIHGDGWLITEQVTVLPCRPSSQHYSPQSHQSATGVNSYHQ